jgi:hypothetical protein
VTLVQHLLHGDETDVFADVGHVGVQKREEIVGRSSAVIGAWLTPYW